MNITTQLHQDNDYPSHDKIQIPVLFSLTDDGKRIYDFELMHDIIKGHIDSIIKHEKHYD